MYDDAGFLILSTISAIVVLGSLAALVWAAVQDGRISEPVAIKARRYQELRP